MVGVYFFRFIQVLYFKGDKTNCGRKDAPMVALIPMFIIVALIVVIGIYPKIVTGVLNSAATELLNRMDYIMSVVG